MAYPNKQNPLISRLRGDNVFGGGDAAAVAQFDREHPFAPSGWIDRAPSPAAPQTPVFGGGMEAPAAPAAAPVSSMNVAAGNIFGGGLGAGERNAIASASAPEQFAGLLSGLEDQGKVAMFQAQLARSGFNLNPVGQLAEDYQGAVMGARNLYNNIFGTPSQPSAPVPTTSFAPTGLRQRALGAGGGEVVGAGGALISAQPNAQGGTAFNLRQNPFAVAAAQRPAPMGSPTPTTQPAGAYDQNLRAFQDHIVAQQTAAGLSKGLEPGYMIDPNNPNAVKPIPGSLAEAKMRQMQTEATEGQAAKAEKTRQTIAQATNVLGTIDRVFPKISDKTTGWGSFLSAIPGSEAKNVEADIKAVNAALGIDTLMEIRNAAKNGASGFGSLTEKEFENIVASKANLDRAQSPEQIRENLTKIRTSYDRLLKMANGINPDLPQTAQPLQIKSIRKL